MLPIEKGKLSKIISPTFYKANLTRENIVSYDVM